MSPLDRGALLRYDTGLGALQAEVSFTDEAVTFVGKEFKVVPVRDPAAWS